MVDNKDKAILRAVQADGRISNVDLAERVGLSESPCYRRVRALEERGVIASYRAELDRQKLGLEVTAFVLVTVENQDDRKLVAFFEAVEAEECIVECHAMSGSHDFLLKTVTRNMDHFSELAMERILKLPGVKTIESNFSLKAVKENAPLPIF
jgi:Lrp/AsnC family leucine-responsive transcriptional regulator